MSSNISPPPHITDFMNAVADTELLLQIHPQIPSPNGLDQETVFLRAMVALLCAAWEAYIEDLLLNACDEIGNRSANPDSLPLQMRKAISRKLKAETHELSPWGLAGDGWRAEIKKFAKIEIFNMNTPKPNNVKALFKTVLGIPDITDCWQWPLFDKSAVCEYVTAFILARGAVAHGRRPDRPLRGFPMIRWKAILVECAMRMNNQINDFVESTTGTRPWCDVRQTNARWSDFANNVMTFDEEEEKD